MNVLREIKKIEAIKRMRALGLYKHCIDVFKRYDERQISEVNFTCLAITNNRELSTKVKEFENEHNALVYHIIRNITPYGELYNFLYVSDYEECWEMNNADIKNNYTMAYVWNKTNEKCSEFGIIKVEQKFGGLVRIV